MKNIILWLFLISIVLGSDHNKQNKTINVAITSTWPPFNYYKKEKTDVTGISVDYWKLISSKMQKNDNIKVMNNFSEVINSIITKEMDIVVNTTDTKERLKYSYFSKSYEVFPIAIATLKNEKFIAKTSLLIGKKVAVGKEYSSYYLLKEDYPNIDYVLVKDTKEALALVAEKKVFAAIDILPTLQYHIENSFSNKVKISGITEKNFYLKIMVRKGLEELIPLINKAIDNITIEERNIIYSKWLWNKEIKKINIYDFISYIVIFVIVILVLIIWNIKLVNMKKIIEEEKEKLDIILKNTPVPILIVDVETKKIVFSNDYANKFYTNYEKELIDEKIDVLYVHDKQREDILSSTDKNGFLKNYETEFRIVNGEKITGLLSVIPIIYHGRKSRLGVVTDVSELKKVQDELYLLNCELENRIDTAIKKNQKQQLMLIQQSKLAQMGEMISMIAHQWRQPLNILALLIQTIENRYKKNELDSESMKELSQKSINQIVLMSKTIDDFRLFFNPEKEKVNFSLRENIYHVLSLLEEAFKRNHIKLEFDMPNEYEYYGYSNEFSQTLINILVNAKDAFSEVEKENKCIKISMQEHNGNYIIKIEDNAIGIPENIINEIFNPYFSTKDQKNGTGLGLYMAKIIIEEHMRGKLNCYNTKDGVCFEILLQSEII